MSLGHAPAIVTNGLIFAYDQANIKSYKGPTMQNIAPAISVVGTGTATGYSSSALTETVDIPGLGPTTVYTNIIQNNYTSYTPNSGSCCPTLHYWPNFAVSPSTLYTYGIVYRCESGYTNSNYMYRYEYTANGGSYVTEGGVHNDANRVHLGGGWYYAWGTFTTQATTNWIGGAGVWYYRYYNLPDRLSVAKVLITPGNYSGLHPKYWPAQATTRSNTQALLDQTGNNTITATSLTYASDGTFSYNGSTNGLTLPGTNFSLNTQTIECWCYSTNFAQSGFMFEKTTNGSVNTQYSFFFNSDGTIYYRTYGPSTTDLTVNYSSAGVVNSKWNHLVATFDGTYKKIYVNGILAATSAALTGTITANTTGNAYVGVYGSFGGYPYNGKLDIVRVYNRALLASDVKQNFNALRGRFGL